MKRLHVSFNVSNLDDSIAFYSNLFATEPSVVHDDYAKWLLDDPRVNFVIEQGSSTMGLTHAGIQTEDEDELNKMFERLQNGEAPYLPQGRTTCCYAESEKSWTEDPDGLRWEAFLTHQQIDSRDADNKEQSGMLAECYNLLLRSI